MSQAEIFVVPNLIAEERYRIAQLQILTRSQVSCPAAGQNVSEATPLQRLVGSLAHNHAGPCDVRLVAGNVTRCLSLRPHGVARLKLLKPRRWIGLKCRSD